jgi:uncharacterized membrane protein HdeD (DUF308 family)
MVVERVILGIIIGLSFFCLVFTSFAYATRSSGKNPEDIDKDKHNMIIVMIVSGSVLGACILLLGIFELCNMFKDKKYNSGSDTDFFELE